MIPETEFPILPGMNIWVQFMEVMADSPSQRKGALSELQDIAFNRKQSAADRANAAYVMLRGWERLKWQLSKKMEKDLRRIAAPMLKPMELKPMAPVPKVTPTKLPPPVAAKADEAGMISAIRAAGLELARVAEGPAATHSARLLAVETWLKVACYPPNDKWLRALREASPDFMCAGDELSRRFIRALL